MSTRRSAPYAVLWDMDGVLVNTGRLHWHAWCELGQEEYFLMSCEDFQRTFGWRNEEILHDLLGPDVPDERVRELGDRKEALYRHAARGRLEPLEGSMRLLTALQNAGFRQAIASSAPQANVDLILRELGIGGYFQAVLSEKDVEQGKPDPQVFLRAAARLGIAPARCLVIEDAVMGVRAAKRAGMACLAVTNTHSADELAEADRVVVSLIAVTVEDVRELVGASAGGDVH